ncbi:MBL fold metallo-hydrolase [Amycolatopsis pithecellobii]|uniref:MBL fold metallo-hydrolase n=1 Tax=Amycolatopsis pithecellobii TaxID=664692 RepID=A0A6N7YZI1_9PSEU|nr:MBL fold metallo-hydrolase [Amycolatopsis pithecellobii]MTD52881.1 MBL fold metallo-hydrolase [Amycolatopsis pithecellobii]
MSEPENLYRGFVPPSHTEEIAAGVFATIQPDGSWGLSNAGFVRDGREVGVIDTLLTEDRTRQFQEEIRRLAGNTRTRYLVNTHHHNDHTFGNYLFDEAAIIGHTECRDEVLATGLAPIGRDPFVPWGDIQVRAPDITFEDRLRLHLGSTRLDLIHVGPAHTRNDVIVWLPESRTLFAGDVLFQCATPIITDGSVTGSVAALDLIASLQPEVIVPGHGELTDVSEVKKWRSYFAFLSEAAAQAHAAGISPLAAAQELDLGEFGAWQHPERVVLNLHRAMAEAGGTPPGERLDSREIFADMLRFDPRAYGHKLIHGRESYVDQP